MKSFVIFIAFIFGKLVQAKVSVTCPDIACILGGGGKDCINTAEIDENGCTRCVCKPFPVCPELICPAIYCEYGRQVVDGCETCQCKPAPVCPKLMCIAIYCEHGRQVVDGCETCLCKPAPVEACLPVACDTACLHGNVVDEAGCKTCECIDPCKGVLCLAPQVCVPDSTVPEQYKCVSQETQCCPKVQSPSNCSVEQNVCQNCFLDCSTMKCSSGNLCCPDWNGCHSCVKAVPCL